MTETRAFHVVTGNDGRFAKTLLPSRKGGCLVDLGSTDGLQRVLSHPSLGQYAIISDFYAHQFEYSGKSLPNIALSFGYGEVYR